MKVDLPPRTPLEADGTFNHTVDELSLENWSSEDITESMQRIQPRIQRFSNLGDALNVLQKIHDDPAEAVFSSKSI